MERWLPFAEHGGKWGLSLFLALADLELAQNRVPADINLMPLVFEVAQGALAHFAEVPQGRSISDQGMNLFLGRS